MSRSIVIASILVVTAIHLGLDFVPAMQPRLLLRLAFEIPMNVFGMLLMYPGIVRHGARCALTGFRSHLDALQVDGDHSQLIHSEEQDRLAKYQ